MNFKKLILPIVLFSLFCLLSYQFFLKKNKSEFSLVEVKKGEVIEEVSETGKVKKGDPINLSFKTPGKIEKIFVKKGDKVKKGDILAKLDDSELKIQLKEAKANLEKSEAALKKLLNGASSEEIEVMKRIIENAKTFLSSQEMVLKDIESAGKETLDSSLKEGSLLLEEVYLKVKGENIPNFIDSFLEKYFTLNTKERSQVIEKKEEIEKKLDEIENCYWKIKEGKENVEEGLSQFKEKLEKISQILNEIREICEKDEYKVSISFEERNSIDLKRGILIEFISKITLMENKILSIKNKNALDIDSQKGRVETAKGELKKAEEELKRILAPAREEDIEGLKAQIKATEAKIEILEKQIEETILKSETEGEVINVKKKEGEILQALPSETVISILPEVPFQIVADIYEGDIGKIKLGDEVEISFVAIPNEKFKGKVVSIDPAEKIKENVVYYEITIDFEKIPEKLKPGMTADLKIKTNFKKDVLVLPEEAIIKKEGETFVKVFKDKKIEERKIETGLFGSNGLVEIVSGLKEGEKVIWKE